VTGGTGFIGSYVAVALDRAGYEVRLLARDPGKVPRVFEPHGAVMADVVRGDITDRASVDAALEGCDAVVHAAAVVSVSRRGAEEVLATNAAGTRNVVGGAVDRGLDPVVYTSSVSALFSAQRPRVTPESPVASPSTPYGRSKAEAERYVQDLQASGAPVAVLYPGGVMGPLDPNVGPGLHGLITNYRSGTPIIRTGGWALVDVRDVADLVVAVMVPGQGPRRLVLGGRTQSMDELNRLLGEVAGRPVRRLPMSPRLLRGIGRVNDLLMSLLPVDFALTGEGMDYLTRWEPSDDSAAMAVLGRDLRPTEETIRDTVRWLVREGHLDARYAPALAG
jgi:nucleoside-diphosphate-sugar epimerase